MIDMEVLCMSVQFVKKWLCSQTWQWWLLSPKVLQKRQLHQETISMFRSFWES